MTAITIIVVLAMGDCGGWLKRRSANPAPRSVDEEDGEQRERGAQVAIGGTEGCADILKKWLPLTDVLLEEALSLLHSPPIG